MDDPVPPSGVSAPTEPVTSAVQISERRSFPNADTCLACLCVAFGIALFLLIPGQVGRPPSLFGISVSDLDPALFPRLIAGGFVVVGVWYFSESRSIADENDLRTLDREALINISVTIILFILYVYALHYFGFIISSAVVIFILCFFYGARNIYGIVATSAAIPIMVYHIFTEYLLVTLPGLPEVLRWN